MDNRQGELDAMNIVARFRVMACLAIGLAATPAGAAAPADRNGATTAGPVVAQAAPEPDCLVMRESRGVMTGADSPSPDDVEPATEDEASAEPDAAAPASAPSGTVRSWIPSDAERDDDRGALTAWLATDAEREEDTGIPSNWITAVDCGASDREGGNTQPARAPSAPAPRP
jgi:hypothetical protein